MSLVEIVRRLVQGWTRYPNELGPASLPRSMLDRLLWINTVVTPIPQILRSNQFMQARGAEWARWKKSIVIHILENFFRFPKAFRFFQGSWYVYARRNKSLRAQSRFDVGH